MRVSKEKGNPQKRKNLDREVQAEGGTWIRMSKEKGNTDEENLVKEVQAEWEKFTREGARKFTFYDSTFTST